jgi:hypothetical protein
MPGCAEKFTGTVNFSITKQYINIFFRPESNFKFWNLFSQFTSLDRSEYLNLYKNLLKGQCHEIFDPRFFH